MGRLALSLPPVATAGEFDFTELRRGGLAGFEIFIVF